MRDHHAGNLQAKDFGGGDPRSSEEVTCAGDHRRLSSGPSPAFPRCPGDSRSRPADQGWRGAVTRASVGLLRVYLDTNVLIRGMERTDAGAGEVGRLIEFAERDRLQLVTSELTLSEVLVGPIRRGDDILATAYLDLLTDEPIFELLPVTRDILIESSQIRARSSAR